MPYLLSLAATCCFAYVIAGSGAAWQPVAAGFGLGAMTVFLFVVRVAGPETED